MTNINNNLPPIEEIREVKNEIPTFAEFMQTYEYDANLNYADLNSWDISEVRGYGPMDAKKKASTSEYCSSSEDRGLIICNRLVKMQYSVHLRIECYSWLGDGETVIVNSAHEAHEQAWRLRDRTWNNAWAISNEVLDKCQYLIYDALIESNNRPVDGYIRVRGKFWGGYDFNKDY